jgi:IS605 OrfB family transposase
LILPKLKKNYEKILRRLYEHSVIDDVPLTFSIDQDYIRISFEEKLVFNVEIKELDNNRVLAIDMNPNYIGYSIVDWKSEREFDVVKAGCYSFKSLNDRQFALKLTKKQRKELKQKERLALTAKAKIKNVYFNNKRKHEIIEVAKNICEIAKQNHCKLVVVEDLNLKNQDRSKGKNLNRLCNSFFIRNAFVNNLSKRCNINDIGFLKVMPQYSSFIGNFLYRSLNLPDPILASIEIGRRGYEFNTQYLDKSKEKSKNIIQPDHKKFDDLISKSLEEFGIKENFRDLVDLYYVFQKDSKMMYRVPFKKDLKWSKFKTEKSQLSKLNVSLSSL